MSDYNFPIETKVVTLINRENGIFTNSKKYSIPAYQRDYSWGEKEVETLLDNIIEGCSSDSPLFVGTIQFSKDSKASDKAFDVVDGQQRLTTIILLFKLIELYTEEDVLKRNNISLVIGKSAELQKQFNDVLEINNLEKVEKLDKSKKGKEAFNAETNVYCKNIRLMRNYIECIDEYKELKKSEKEITFIEKLKEYILEKLYFVELTTDGLGIPETVKIFNTINTTGLDLNSSDVFKLQYYQYLKDRDGKENWIEKINSCYEELESFKVKHSSSPYVNSNLTMSWILDIYKHILSAKYELKWENLSKSNENFFEWIFKKENSNEREDLLEFEVFEKVVKNFLKIFEYTLIKKGNFGFRFCAQKLIEITRYSRYRTLPYVISFFKADNYIVTESDIDFALDMSLTISKYFIVNSVLYDKVINPVQTFMCNEVLPAISKVKNEDKVTALISNKIWQSPYDSEWDSYEDFKERVEQKLFENGSRCHLICTLSAILDENEKSDIRKLFFNWKENPYDNEHIWPQNRFKEWPAEDCKFVNGIGNLVTLEANINRSVKDDISKKVKQYPNSKFASIKEILNQCPSMEWTVDNIKDRKDAKMGKIKGWLGRKE